MDELVLSLIKEINHVSCLLYVVLNRLILLHFNVGSSKAIIVYDVGLTVESLRTADLEL